jgi:predicted Zn-dependent protease
MHDAFASLAERLGDELVAGERLLLNLRGEHSDFVRFNHAKIRQAGSVRRHLLSLSLIDGQRQARAAMDVTGQIESDLAEARRLLARMRLQLPHLPEDPYLNIGEDPLTGDTPPNASTGIDSAAALEDILAAAVDTDLVGLFAAGRLHNGFADSTGRHAWHESANFHVDWSLYADRDKAVKRQLGGTAWDKARLAHAMREACERLDIMRREPRTISPGCYRVYLAPPALREIIDMMAWDGFGLKSHRTGRTPLLRMITESRRLHPAFTLRENSHQGFTPPFTAEGFLKAPVVDLIRDGRYAQCLVDARSAREFDTPVNAAAEYPEALDLAPGELSQSRVLAELDTGLYVNNLWYLNFSDRDDCRLTGMTRFACFWVENGEIREPVNVMRFDESVYRMLGEKLLGLTDARELIFDENTYGGRSLRSYRLPGALVEGMRFTL